MATSAPFDPQAPRRRFLFASNDLGVTQGLNLYFWTEVHLRLAARCDCDSLLTGPGMDISSGLIAFNEICAVCGSTVSFSFSPNRALRKALRSLDPGQIIEVLIR